MVVDIESWGLVFTMWLVRVDSAYFRPRSPLQQSGSHMQRNIKEVTVGLLFITARLFYAIIMRLPGSKSLPQRRPNKIQFLKCSPRSGRGCFWCPGRCQWARTNNNQRFSRPLINRDGGILICVKFKPINLPAHTRIIHKSIWDMNNDLV